MYPFPGVVDTHCHMDMVLGKFNLGVESFPEWRAGLPKEQSFEACLTIGCSTDAFNPTASMLKFDGVYGAFGIHPLSAREWSPSVRDQILQLQVRDAHLAFLWAGNAIALCVSTLLIAEC